MSESEFDKFIYVVGSNNDPLPGSREIRWGSPLQTGSSEIYISRQTNNIEGLDVELDDYFEPDNSLVIHDSVNASSFQEWIINEVNSDLENGYYTLHVTFTNAGGTGATGFGDSSEVFIYLEEIVNEGTEVSSLDTKEMDSIPGSDAKTSESILEKEISKEVRPSNEEIMRELSAERDKLEEARSKVDDTIRRWDQTRQQFFSWQDRHARSFLWKTLDAMNKNLQDAENKLSEYEEIVRNVKIPNAGRMQELRKKFHKKLLTMTTVIPLICLVILQLPVLLGFSSLNGYLAQFGFAIANPLRTVVMYASILYLLLLISALITYYRGWSGYERNVRVTLWELTSVSQGVNHVRNEEIRLKDLYPKIKDWLEILGNSLTNPWRIRDEWLAMESTSLNAESLPYSLRVAQPNEGESSSNIAMQREAAEKFMVKGWRAKIFADQVEVIRQTVGMSEERLSVEQLDKDVSYSPNGPRAIIYRYISDNSVLEKVGRRQLIPLIAEVQQKGMTETRPPVSEIRKRNINIVGMRRTKSDIDEEKQVGWDEFLSYSIPVQGRPRTPLSVLGLSDEGKMRNYQDKYETFVILPKRFENQVGHLDPSNIYSYEEHEKLPIDLVVRTDFTGPVSEEHLLFLAGAKPRKKKENSEVEKEIEKKLKDKQSGID